MYGISHQGETVISECEVGTGLFTKVPEESGRALCFRFDGTKPAETRIGPFDSGGPMFSIDEATGEQVLVGIALGSEPARGPDGNMQVARYVNLTDPFYRQWLDERAFSGNFNRPPYFIDTLIEHDARKLQPGKMARFDLKIGESSERLLLTLNHDPGPSQTPNNLDLLLPEGLDADCERLASVEVCSVESPPAGSYRIAVAWGESCRAKGACGDPVGSSAYQVTAIALYDKSGAGE